MRPLFDKFTFLWIALFVFHCSHSLAEDTSQGNGQETQEQFEERLRWWNTARFGMFVHWGIYSVSGGEYKGQELPNSAEWMMNRGKIPIAEYEQYATQFNPTNFDADSFVQLDKETGMKYLVITAKHHDGFSMFGSTSNPFNVVEATPFKRDIMKELAQACQEHGIRFGFYYSQAQDWHHPGGHGNNWDPSIQRVSNDEYVHEKAAPEVKQLLTEYGPIGIFCWDTPRAMSKQALDNLHSLTEFQPGIITNDRLGDDYSGDYQTFERSIPDRAPTDKDWEVCMPISGSWGYKRSDTRFKSSETLIRNLVDIASKGGNYLLNVSPTGDGTLLPESIERLKAIGTWMKTNSESIYGTSASPFAKLEWGRCTKKEYANGSILYLHVFDWPYDGELVVPGLKNKVQQSYLMADWEQLKTRNEEDGLVVSLPKEAPDEFVSVVVLKVHGALDVENALPAPQEDGSVVLSADEAYIHNNEGSSNARIQHHSGIANIGYWSDAEAWIEWSFSIDTPGDYELVAEIAVEESKSAFFIETAGTKTRAEVVSTGGYGIYSETTLGSVQLEKAGEQKLQIQPDTEHWHPINLRNLTLKLR